MHPLALQTLTRGARAFFVVPAPPLLILSRKGGYRGPGGSAPGRRAVRDPAQVKIFLARVGRVSLGRYPLPLYASRGLV